jgi:hypothetical protein
MLVDSSNSNAGSAVTGAIRQAAQATGTSFQYLLATAQVESGLNPQAGASTSSARGLFQFVEQTWLGTMKQSGATLGYGKYADAITRTGSGHYEVRDPTMRSEILKLRNDPTANAVMAGVFTRANAAQLSERLGRSPSEGELYIAHFLGAGGAGRLISLAAGNPNASAAASFPNAAHANPSIFYDRTTGAARSLAQVRDILTARYDVAARINPGEPVTAQATIKPRSAAAAAQVSGVSFSHPIRTISISRTAASAPAAAVAADSVAAGVPDTAGLTSAFADAAPKHSAPDTEVFHGLFQDPGRNGPVAAVVSQLWGVANPAPGAGSTPPAGSMLDLFKDNARGT